MQMESLETNGDAMDPTARRKKAGGDSIHQDPMTLPRDAKLVSLILQAMDIPDYDPRVLPQLLEFMHRYVLDILADAQLFSEHASRSNIEVDDVRLAVEGKVAHSFTSAPSKEVLLEMAQARNAIPLPLMQEKYGLRLPPERNCLTGINFNIIPQRIAAPASEPFQMQPQQPSALHQPAWAVPSGYPPSGASLAIPRSSIPMGLPTPAPMVIAAPSGIPTQMIPMPASRSMATANTSNDMDDYDDEEEGTMPSQPSRPTGSGGSQQTRFKGEDDDFDMA
ncbi:Transcription initiation factor TFIID subunit 9B [Dinochytrium kinnereticum]|nr:Transcription initiation factor TFIID subunit 9B [Dinochytrium kinnereticum]